MVKAANKIKQIVPRLVKNLEASGIKVSRLILYGSYARGCVKPYSDIDIAVISPTFNKQGILKRQELLGEAIFPLGEPIDFLFLLRYSLQGKQFLGINLKFPPNKPSKIR